MAALVQRPTAYEILGVHSSAPAELLSACYWAMARDLQEKRAAEPEIDAALHRLTHAYESVSDPVRRAGYNMSIGYTDEPLTKRALPRRTFFLLRIFSRNRQALDWSVDAHEVLGLHPHAPQASVPIAYRLMRDTYLRLAPGSRRREALLNLLDESYAIVGDPEKRAQLPGVEPVAEHESPARARDDPPVSDLPEPSPPDRAATKVALPVPAPSPPVESSRPPKTPLSVPGGTVGERAGQEDGGGERWAAVAVVVFAVAAAATTAGIVARGVRWVVLAVAAVVVVAAGAVATAVHWAALAVAALTMAAARPVAPYVRSAWRALRRWHNPSVEERQEIRTRRAGEASSRLLTPDEVFLGRLASTVGRSKTERPSSDQTTRR